MNIVLAHGFLGFNEIGPVNYFNGIAADLTAYFPGLRAYATRVDPAGRITNRGAAVAQQIAKALVDGTLDAGQPTHVIAHSMGGLDARYAISPDNNANIGNRIASLTTIGTPHRGSPIADLLDNVGMTKVLEAATAVMGGQWAATSAMLNQMGGGLADLTTPGAVAFNAQYRDNPNVRYYWCAGRGRPTFLHACLILSGTYEYLRGQTELGNDGLVTVESATWGEQASDLWPGDHADEIGHDLDHGVLAETAYIDFKKSYRQLVARLDAAAGPA